MISESGQFPQVDIWTVRFPSGQVKPLTLDELDAAYNAGQIDESTPVLASGSLAWSTLGVVAGLAPPEPMPLSIAPVSWGPDIEIEVTPGDLDDMPAELKPRRGARKVFGVLVAFAVIGGLGFAATRAKPGLGASAIGFVKSHVPGRKAAEPPKAVAAAPAKVEAAPPAPAPAPPPAAPVVTATPAASAPALAADQLPDAKKGAKKKGKSGKNQ